MSINNTSDIIDVRDVIEAVELGDAEHDDIPALTGLLAELAGNGGDEQYQGDWYPLTLIRESYFQEYAQELAEDTGAISDESAWPSNCIDWEWAARELQMDYISVEYSGITYWYR